MASFWVVVHRGCTAVIPKKLSHICPKISVFVPCSLIFSDSSPLVWECFPLCYLNCSSFVVNVSTVIFFPPPTGQQKDCLGITKGMHWRESVEYSWTWQLSHPHYGIHELWVMEMCVYINMIRICVASWLCVPSHYCTSSIHVSDDLHFSDTNVYGNSCQPVVAWVSNILPPCCVFVCSK